MEFGINFDNGSVDEIFTSHFLEHVKNPYFILDEIYRVCKADAKIEIRVPLYQVWQPDHLTCFYEDWFEKNATKFEVVCETPEKAFK
mgnify:CR=1 FL=1